MVNHLDIQAIVDNYGLTHPQATSTAYNPNFIFRLEPIGESDSKHYRYQVFIENITGAEVWLHGVSCTFDFFFLIQDVTVNVENSSLQPKEHLVFFDELNNRLSIALTRTDKVNALCSEAIAELDIVIEDDLPTSDPFAVTTAEGGVFVLTANTPSLIAANHNVIADYSLSTVQSIDENSPIITKQLSISPNPSHGQLNIKANLRKETDVQINLYDMRGELVFTRKKRGTYIEDFLDTSSFNSGMYMLQFIAEDEIQNHKVLFMNE